MPVIRNRTRRRMKEACPASCCVSARSRAWNLVLIGRDTTRDRPFTELVADLRRALDKAGVA